MDERYVAGMMAMADQLKPAITNSANDTWVHEFFGGQSTDAGVTVNYGSSMTLASVTAAQQIISGDVARPPFDTKRTEPDGDLVLDTSIPAHWLMNGDANRNMTSYAFRSVMTHHALMSGNGMAYILREGTTPVELIPAVRGALKPVINSAGVLVYVDTADERVWSQWDILHIKGLSDDGISGLSWLNLARNSVGLGLAENRHGSRLFAKGAKPSLVLTHPGRFNKEDADQLLERFEERHENDSRPALAAGGLQVQDFPVKNSDAQWLESRKFTRQEIAAWFNLPPHKIGDSERVAYNSILAENQAYVTQTLSRWFKCWESEVSRKLIPQRERVSRAISVMHDPKVLIETDVSEITERVTKQVGSMIITVNEARRELGYSRIEGGDVLMNPNTTSGEQPTPEPEPAPTPATSAAGMRTALVAALDDRLTTLCNALSSQCSRRRNKGETLDGDWVSTWQEKAVEYAAPTLAVVSASGLESASVEMLKTTVTDWAATLWNGDAAIPSPTDLANQMIGAATHG